VRLGKSAFCLTIFTSMDRSSASNEAARFRSIGDHIQTKIEYNLQ
jgi:hypothetical protein